jgi:flagellar operon protein
LKDISASFSSIRNLPGVGESQGQPQTRAKVDEGKFKEQLEALKNSMPSTAAPQTAAATALKFSNHAVDRMQTRGISFSPEQMAKIESAVNKAASKGAKNTLLLTDAAAMIVSVKDKTVVTVMDSSSLKENVFTNIDSTVMV